MKVFLTCVLALLAMSSTAFADWVLVKEESAITFTSTKKEKIVEVHSFMEFAGQVLQDGRAAVDINLASAETNIDIRNDRLDTLLFQVSKFAGAKVKGTVNIDKVTKLMVGESFSETIDLSLYLHGINKEVAAKVEVTKLTADKVKVTSLSPVIISAGDYGLAEGVEALRKVANLSSINLSVPVNFDLVFEK